MSAEESQNLHGWHSGEIVTWSIGTQINNEVTSALIIFLYFMMISLSREREKGLLNV